MHLTIIVLLIFGSFSILLTKTTDDTSRDYSETPSPEWIKYQKERNDPKYNRRNPTTTPDLGLKNSAVVKQPVSVNPNSKPVATIQVKVETSSRQRSDHDKKREDQYENTHVDEEVTNHWEKNDKSETDEFVDSNATGLKFPSISGFVDFVKSLKRTWMKKSLFRIDNKIAFLYNLKETLMRAIEQQFMSIWPEADPDADGSTDSGDDEGRHLRHKRGILDESNINFPPEAALMSINFLTFAVFLIKLVMQVVNIIKSKHYQFSALGLNADNYSKG